MLADLFAYMTTAPSPDADPTRASALVSLQTLIGTRLYPDFLPEGTPLPAGVYNLISSEQEYTLDGEAIDFRSDPIQLDWYANSVVTRDQLGKFARTALEGVLGNMAGTNVGMVVVDDESNMYEPDTLRFRKMQQMKFIYYT